LAKIRKGGRRKETDLDMGKRRKKRDVLPCRLLQCDKGERKHAGRRSSIVTEKGKKEKKKGEAPQVYKLSQAT